MENDGRIRENPAALAAALHVLPEGANPRPWERTRDPDEMELLRWLGCPHYSRCLDLAIWRLWLCFTCIHCPLWTRRPL